MEHTQSSEIIQTIEDILPVIIRSSPAKTRIKINEPRICTPPDTNTQTMGAGTDTNCCHRSKFQCFWFTLQINELLQRNAFPGLFMPCQNLHYSSTLVGPFPRPIHHTLAAAAGHAHAHAHAHNPPRFCEHKTPLSQPIQQFVF